MPAGAPPRQRMKKDKAIQSASNVLLELNGVWKTYAGGVAAVAGIDLVLKEGEFVSLLGPSGSGKSTTLRMIAGFERPTAGEILLEGRRLDLTPPNKRPVNTVFQDYALFPHLSVYDNVAFGLRAERTPRVEVERRVRDMLRLVALEDLAGRSPSQLSGGQRQRTALARALVLRPRVLLLDEPLGALDMKLRRQMQFVLMELCRQLGTTFLYVTHDQEEALSMSDHVAVINAGKLEQFATPEVLYKRPVNSFVADFVGETNLLAVCLRERLGDIAIVDFEGRALGVDGTGLNGVSPGARLTIALRPELLRLTREPPDESGIPVVVLQSMFVAGDNRVVVKTEGGKELLVRGQSEEALRLERDARVTLQFDRSAARTFRE